MFSHHFKCFVGEEAAFLTFCYRDDLTVEVIFFGEGGAANGSVTLNKEASAPAPADPKAKL